MASFFDDFNRSNGSLGNNWVNIVGSFSIVSNTVYAGTVGLNYNSVNANSAIFSTNQSSQITVSSLRAIDRVGPAVRVTSNGAYVIRVDGQNNSIARILRFNGNTATSIGTVNIVPANGDIVKLTATGNTLRAYINDVLIDTVNIQDANTANVFTTGQPGLFYNWGDIRQTRIDNFYATDLAQIFSVDTDNNIFPGQTNVIVSGENLGEATKANLVFGSKSIDMLGFTSNVSAPTFNVPNIASIKTAGFEFGDVYLVLANSNTVIVNTSITLSPPAGYGVHDVTDLTYSNDPNNMYYGQVPAIEVGDQILYDNSPNVFIDYVGYPELSNGATSFTYSIYDTTYGTWSIDSTVSIQKEINAVSRSFGVRKSADGKQYSKYPAGDFISIFSDNFESYSTIADAINGPWDSQDTALGGTHAITTFGGSKRYACTWTQNESRTLLYYRFPGAVNGDDSTGKSYVKLEWDEYRDANWDFQADKSCRFVGRLGNGNVTLDILLGLEGSGTPGNSTRAVVFGQGLANGSTFIVDTDWNMNREQWYRIAVEIQLNTVGNSDGWIKLWRDGVLMGSTSNTNLRLGSNTYTFHQVAVGGWESGGAPAASETRYIDNVTVTYSNGY